MAWRDDLIHWNWVRKNKPLEMCKTERIESAADNAVGLIDFLQVQRKERKDDMMRIRNMTTLTAFCCAVFYAMCPVHADSALKISAPLERQVCQRNNNDQAGVVIAGVLIKGADVIEVKADLAAGAERGEAVGWIEVARGEDITDGTFTGQMSLKAGGWYTITVRARQGKEIVGEATIRKVGVGEVFITAGQSNSANYGRPRQTAKDDRVVYFNGTGFVPAQDPIPGGCGGGGSVWPIVGDLITKSQRVPVCFRSASLTWTEVKNWMPGVKYKKWTLYDNLVQCVGEFPKNGVRAILWHQGESDSLAKTPAQTYCDRLKTIIESLNKDAGYDLRWFVAQASFHPGSKEPEEKEVAKGQQLLWEKNVAKRGPNTDELGQEYRSDRVHFNQKGLSAHAERWWKALAAEYEWKAESSNTSMNRDKP